MAIERYGHVKISRKAYAEDPWWNEVRVFSKWEAWEDCIQMATWRQRQFAVGFHVERLSRGEFLVSLRFLAERWNWTVKRVRLWLEACEKGSRLRAQRETQHGTVYLLVNYDKYQGADYNEGAPEGIPGGTDRAQEGHKTEAVKQLSSSSSLTGRENRDPEVRDTADVVLATLPAGDSAASPQKAFTALMRSCQNPEAFAAEVLMILQGGRSFSPQPTPEQVGNALWALHLNGVRPNQNVLHGYVRGAMRGTGPPKQPNVSQSPSKPAAPVRTIRRVG